MRHVGDVCLALHHLPQPTIAKVNGIAVGAGLNLALGCDLIVASTEARFSEIFARRGLSVDFGGSWVLPRLIGMHRAKELVFLADIIDAAEAERLGLVNKVVAPGELDAAVADWAGRLADGPPIALAHEQAACSNNAFGHPRPGASTTKAAPRRSTSPPPTPPKRSPRSSRSERRGSRAASVRVLPVEARPVRRRPSRVALHGRSDAR